MLNFYNMKSKTPRIFINVFKQVSIFLSNSKWFCLWIYSIQYSIDFVPISMRILYSDFTEIYQLSKESL